MAGLADLFGGNSAFGSGALYGDLLSPEQKQALAWRGLMSAAGALGQAAMPSRMPVPLGAALGQAAGAMASGSDEAALNALRATMLAQQAQQLKQKNDFVNKLFGNLPGLLDSVTGTNATPAAATQPSAAPTATLTGADTIEPPSAIAAPNLGDGMRAGGALTGDPLALIEKYESGGRNIMQQAVPPEGGYNPSVGRVTGPSTAQGYYQITNSTWRDTAPKAGVDLSQYPTAMSAPKDVQAQVAQTLFNEQGFAPWAPYNPKLAAAINSGPAAQPAPFGSFAPQVPATQTLSPQALKTIIGMGIAGDLFGVPSLGTMLTNTPQYKAAIETATRGAGLPFVGPEALAKQNAVNQSDLFYQPQIQGGIETAKNAPLIARAEAQAAIDRLSKQLEQNRAAQLDLTTVPRVGPGGTIVEVPATRYDAAIAASAGSPAAPAAPVNLQPGGALPLAPQPAAVPSAAPQAPTAAPVLGKPMMGAIPPGYDVRVTPQGTYTLAPTIGGPVARAEEQKGQSKQQSADIVTQDVDRALRLSSGWTTGTGGALFQSIPETQAHDLQNLLLSIRTNTGLDRLQQMRDASPTGGALGQVSDYENKMLASALGSLEQSQTKDQFDFNMRRIHDLYRSAVDGSPEKLNQSVKEGKITPAQRDEALAKRYDYRLRTEALDAIAKGAPKDVVIKRLREMGGDASGL